MTFNNLFEEFQESTVIQIPTSISNNASIIDKLQKSSIQKESKGICRILGCDREVICKNLCVSCYHRNRRKKRKRDEKTVDLMTTKEGCSIEGCKRLLLVNKTYRMCDPHYKKFRKGNKIMLDLLKSVENST